MSKRALLVDVGGTLVPDNLPDAPGVREVRLARLAGLLPELDASQLAQFLDRLLEDARQQRDQLVQRTDEMIAGALAWRWTLGDLAARAGQVCRAMGRPTGHEHPPFPGYRDLLRTPVSWAYAACWSRTRRMSRTRTGCSGGWPSAA